MKQTINFSNFLDAFTSAGRNDQFGYEALRLIFDYLESSEEGCGVEIELDVVAICCDYEERSIGDFIADYNLPADCASSGDDEKKELIEAYIQARSSFVGFTSDKTVVYQQF